MQTAISETEIRSRYLSICVHHYFLRAPCPKGQGSCVQYVCENTGVPQKIPNASDVQASPSLRRDLLSLGSAFGEPVTVPHVAHTWPLGWTVGSIGGDTLRSLRTRMQTATSETESKSLGLSTYMHHYIL